MVTEEVVTEEVVTEELGSFSPGVPPLEQALTFSLSSYRYFLFRGKS